MHSRQTAVVAARGRLFGSQCSSLHAQDFLYSKVLGSARVVRVTQPEYARMPCMQCRKSCCGLLLLLKLLTDLKLVLNDV